MNVERIAYLKKCTFQIRPISSIALQDSKETKCYAWTRDRSSGQTDNVKTVYPTNTACDVFNKDYDSIDHFRLR